jgi:hypothetical protein
MMEGKMIKAEEESGDAGKVKGHSSLPSLFTFFAFDSYDFAIHDFAIRFHCRVKVTN